MKDVCKFRFWNGLKYRLYDCRKYDTDDKFKEKVNSECGLKDNLEDWPKNCGKDGLKVNLEGSLEYKPQDGIKDDFKYGCADSV